MPATRRRYRERPPMSHESLAILAGVIRARHHRCFSERDSRVSVRRIRAPGRKLRELDPAVWFHGRATRRDRSQLPARPLLRSEPGPVYQPRCLGWVSHHANYSAAVPLFGGQPRNLQRSDWNVAVGVCITLNFRIWAFGGDVQLVCVVAASSGEVGITSAAGGERAAADEARVLTEYLRAQLA